jgi:hypothetical protein
MLAFELAAALSPRRRLCGIVSIGIEVVLCAEESWTKLASFVQSGTRSIATRWTATTKAREAI